MAVEIRRADHIIYPQKLALSLPTSGGHSVGTVRLRTTVTEFIIIITIIIIIYTYYLHGSICYMIIQHT
jgi:hypothetical protein